MATEPETAAEEIQSDPVILITGVTGYVGHHLLGYILKSYPSSIVHGTHRSNQPVIKNDRVRYFNVDVTRDESVKSAVSAMFSSGSIPDIIIHCAAATKPGFCQKNKAKSMRINCPPTFIQILLSHYTQHDPHKKPLFVLFSTDHVYDGELADPNTIQHAPMFNVADSEQKSDDQPDAVQVERSRFYTEKSPCYPLNHYGQSKLKMEEYLLMHWDNLVILRCSNIYGPPIGNRGTMLQFVISQLGDGHNEKVTLFKNETRNFVCIHSVVKAVEHFIVRYQGGSRDFHDIYNCGSTKSLNRVEFGTIIGREYGLDTSKIDGVNRFEFTQKWAHQAPNPQDVTMSSDKLHQEMKDFYTFPSFEDAIKQIKAETT